jgi:hypothetical protein
MSAPSLKPCPFCGNADLRHSHVTGAVFCEECGCEGPWSPAFDGDWNTRADLPPTLAQALALPEIAALVKRARAEALEDAAKIVRDMAQEILDHHAPASAVNALKAAERSFRALKGGDA